MEQAKKEVSHIRQKVEFTGEAASQTLDAYYEQNVKGKIFQCRKTQWLRRFRQTHYFGPNYWMRQPANTLAQSLRLEDLRRQIREAKAVIHKKSKLDHHTRWLDQLTASLNRETARKEALKAQAQAQAQVQELAQAQEQVQAQEQPEQQQPQPLVLMVGDEILYDEEYKCDPLWEQVEEERSYQ